MKYGEMIHAIHPEHALEMEHKGSPYICDACGQVGFNSRYACKQRCDVHLHKDCADPPPTIKHPFFPACRFVFLASSPPNKICDACGGDVAGAVYHCFGDECSWCQGFDLHPCCANLEREMEAEGVKLKLKLKKKTTKACYFCGERELVDGVRSWSYVASREGIHIHVACVKKMLLKSWDRDALAAARDGGGGGGDGMAMEKWAPKLQVAVRNDRRGTGKWTRLKKIIKIAITFIMAAIVGDPTAMVAGLLTNLIAH